MHLFPFPAIVGLDDAKKSLLYHAIDPRIGGVLLLGHRGCAKSTLVRAFAEILGALDGSAPFVELPLGATEDRLIGSVNAEALVQEGRWQGRLGLIEEANLGVLYVDEVNLLPDHLADLLLDSAATGHHRVERDGLSRQVESRYILIGTMNPEEGDLRPQLADRFAHGIRIADDFTPEQRVEIVARRMQFDDEPEAFLARFASETATLQTRLAQARTRLRQITIPDDLRTRVATAARDLKLEGLRPELAVLRTARCAAAWAARDAINEDDIHEAWRLCLGHRHDPQPPVPPPPPTSTLRPPHRPTSASTPQTPLDAHRTPRTLVETERSEPALQRWFSQALTFPRHLQSAHTSRITPTPTGPISWLGSLIASIISGRSDRRTITALCYFTPSAPSAWFFLDASRSSGGGNFLARARSALISLAQREKSTRYHLLVLQNNTLRWLTRRASACGLQKALHSIKDASGKSLIIEGLGKLRRARGKYPNAGTVIICSDGLATPAPSSAPGETFSKLRSALKRLTLDHRPVAWFHPRSVRALTTWLPRVCEAVPITRFTSSD